MDRCAKHRKIQIDDRNKNETKNENKTKLTAAEAYPSSNEQIQVCDIFSLICRVC